MAYLVRTGMAVGIVIAFFMHFSRIIVIAQAHIHGFVNPAPFTVGVMVGPSAAPDIAAIYPRIVIFKHLAKRDHLLITGVLGEIPIGDNAYTPVINFVHFLDTLSYSLHLAFDFIPIVSLALGHGVESGLGIAANQKAEIKRIFQIGSAQFLWLAPIGLPAP